MCWLLMGEHTLEFDRDVVAQALRDKAGVQDLSRVSVGIAADEAVAYERVVLLMDLLQQAGVESLVFVVSEEVD